MTLHVVEHPLVAHYLTRLRDRETTPDEFREASDKIITLLLYEATRDLRTRTYRMQTPLEETTGYAIGDRVVAVPILRVTNSPLPRRNSRTECGSMFSLERISEGTRL